MRKTFTLAVAMFAITCVAQERPILGTGFVPEIVPPPIPTRRIVPSEVVQESIRLVRTSTKQIGVMWTYTEAGATNMLAFRDAHEGETVRLVIGTWQSRPHEYSRALPAQWREGWLKRRTDKIVGVSEDDAQKIIPGLTQ